MLLVRVQPGLPVFFLPAPRQGRKREGFEMAHVFGPIPSRRLEEIGPDQVHLLVPDRPPSEEWVRPASREKVELAREILGGAARVLSLYDPANFDLSGGKSLVQAILDVIQRHPMKEEELLAALERYAPNRVQETLSQLQRTGRARLVTRLDGRFWVSASTRFQGEKRVK